MQCPQFYTGIWRIYDQGPHAPHRDRVGVEQNRDGIGKLDAVFAPIGALLVRVPLELHVIGKDGRPR